MLKRRSRGELLGGFGVTGHAQGMPFPATKSLRQLGTGVGLPRHSAGVQLQQRNELRERRFGRELGIEPQEQAEERGIPRFRARGVHGAAPERGITIRFRRGSARLHVGADARKGLVIQRNACGGIGQKGGPIGRFFGGAKGGHGKEKKQAVHAPCIAFFRRHDKHDACGNLRGRIC